MCHGVVKIWSEGVWDGSERSKSPIWEGHFGQILEVKMGQNVYIPWWNQVIQGLKWVKKGSKIGQNDPFWAILAGLRSGPPAESDLETPKIAGISSVPSSRSLPTPRTSCAIWRTFSPIFERPWLGDCLRRFQLDRFLGPLRRGFGGGASGGVRVGSKSMILDPSGDPQRRISEDWKTDKIFMFQDQFLIMGQGGQNLWSQGVKIYDFGLKTGVKNTV